MSTVNPQLDQLEAQFTLLCQQAKKAGLWEEFQRMVARVMQAMTGVGPVVPPVIRDASQLDRLAEKALTMVIFPDDSGPKCWHARIGGFEDYFLTPEEAIEAVKGYLRGQPPKVED